MHRLDAMFAASAVGSEPVGLAMAYGLQLQSANYHGIAS